VTPSDGCHHNDKRVNSLISATEEELKVTIPKLTTFYDEVSEACAFNRDTKAGEKAS